MSTQPARQLIIGIRRERALAVEITGWDSVAFTFTQPKTVFARVFAAVLARWPAALVDDLDSPQSGPVPAAGFLDARLPRGDRHLLFSWVLAEVKRACSGVAESLYGTNSLSKDKADCPLSES